MFLMRNLGLNEQSIYQHVLDNHFAKCLENGSKWKGLHGMMDGARLR
jgi:hypothetical protein